MSNPGGEPACLFTPEEVYDLALAARQQAEIDHRKVEGEVNRRFGALVKLTGCDSDVDQFDGRRNAAFDRWRRAGVSPLAEWPRFVADLPTELRAARDALCDALAASLDDVAAHLVEHGKDVVWQAADRDAYCRRRFASHPPDPAEDRQKYAPAVRFLDALFTSGAADRKQLQQIVDSHRVQPIMLRVRTLLSDLRDGTLWVAPPAPPQPSPASERPPVAQADAEAEVGKGESTRGVTPVPATGHEQTPDETSPPPGPIEDTGDDLAPPKDGPYAPRRFRFKEIDEAFAKEERRLYKVLCLMWPLYKKRRHKSIATLAVEYTGDPAKEIARGTLAKYVRQLSEILVGRYRLDEKLEVDDEFVRWEKIT